MRFFIVTIAILRQAGGDRLRMGHMTHAAGRGAVKYPSVDL